MLSSNKEEILLNWGEVLIELMNYLDFDIIKNKVLEEVKDKGNISLGETE